MIGMDTNVLVRFLVQDDPLQSAQASAAFARLTSADRGYLSTVVLVETYWVLNRAYTLPPEEVLSALEEVVSCEEISVQDSAQATSAFQAARAGADFADALIAAACAAQGCRTVLSFDEGTRRTLNFTTPA